MVYNPLSRNKILAFDFPKFQMNDCELLFVSSFRYLGHIIDKSASDNDDIDREIRNLFVRTNILIRKFHNCSHSVKILLFKSFCLCFYGLSLWKSFSTKCIERFKAAYHKCIKNFFRFARRDSVTGILLALGLSSFDTVMWNAKQTLVARRNTCANVLVEHISLIHQY